MSESNIKASSADEIYCDDDAIIGCVAQRC